MSIHINWGAPGSYKTSHSVLEAISVLLGSNRFFVTNVRGLNPDTVYKYFGKNYPNYIAPFRKQRFFNISSELLELDSTDRDAVLKYFPLWLPFGSFFLFDEIQLTYPKNFPAKEFTANFSELTLSPVINELAERFSTFTEELISENLDVLKQVFTEEYSISPDHIEFREKFSRYVDSIVLSRPKNLLECFSKHRHYGWDFSFTCQDLSQLSSSVLAVCESAHYQQNMSVNFAFLGKGRYKRFFHSTQRTSPTPRDPGTFHRIDTRVFKCYSSTQLGQATDTLAAQNPFVTAPFLKLYFLFLVLLACIYYFISNYEHLPFFAQTQKSLENHNQTNNDTIATATQINSITDRKTAETPKVSVVTGTTAPRRALPPSQNPTLSTSGIVALENEFLDDFQKEDVQIYISGYYRSRRNYRYAGQIHYPDGSISSFIDLPPPYYARPYSACYYALYRLDRLVRYIHCPPQPQAKNQDDTNQLKKFLIR